MEQGTLSLLTGWTNFYVIVGSSAGALTGLQFVVMTLIAGARVESSMREVRAFGTPTVVHFCAALLVSAIMSAPWHRLRNIGLCLVCCGIAGVAYAISIIWHARRTTYRPDTEDWIWYVAFPFVAYTSLVGGAILLRWQTVLALFVIAGTTLLFLFIGIRNSWDTVTYITIRQQGRESKQQLEH